MSGLIHARIHAIGIDGGALDKDDFLAITTVAAYASETPELWAEFAAKKHHMCADCAADVLLVGLVAGAYVADVHADAHHGEAA